jgi:DNA-binding SARP family transcriptional activator
VQVRLLGPVDIAGDGAPQAVNGRRRTAVLAALALEPGRALSVDRLIGIVWDDRRPPVNAVNTLQSHISHLRRILGARSAIVAQMGGYVFPAGPAVTDVLAAEELIRQAARTPDPAGAAAQLGPAVALWRGQPLMGLTELDFFADHAVRLEQLFLRARLALFDARLALGQHVQLIPELRDLGRAHPLHEQLHGQLMTALYRSGQRSEALSVYESLRSRLDEELGVPPPQPVRDLHGAILRQDARLDLARTPVPLSAGTAGRIRFGGRAVIGRDAELAVLRAAVEGRGRAVFLVGEPGIGKTRLAEETARLATAGGLRVFRGRAGPAGAHFRALSEALLSQLRWSAPPRDAGLGPYRPVLARLLPEWRTGDPAGYADEPPAVLAEAMLRLMVTLGRPAGSLLVLEDLHDADADTLAVLDYLVDNLRGEPLVLLATARPDPGAALDLVRAAGFRRSAEVLDLARLDDDQVRRLAAGCLDTGPERVPGPVLERLAGTADGIPLHVEELLAAMVSDRVLTAGADGWQARHPLPAQIPVTLAATLAGRVARLGAGARRLLQAAALLGRQFDATVAARAAGTTEEELPQLLRAAVDAALLTPGQTTVHYGFRHALTAEALRSRLLPIEVVALARRAAEALEQDAGAAWELPAAELWCTAGEPQRAAVLFGSAGRRAAAEGAVSTGIELLERALAGHPGPPPVDLGLALVDAYAVAGRIADAYAAGNALHAPVAAGRGQIQLHLARVASLAGDWERGLAAVAAAIELFGESLDPATAAQLDAVAARLAFGRPAGDRRAAAERLAHRALRGAHATGQPDVACRALEVLGRSARLRSLTEAEAFYAQGLAVAEANNLVARKVSLLYQIAAHDGIRTGDTRPLAHALAVANDAGAVVTALDVELELAVVQICRGDGVAAAAAARRCEQTAERLRMTHTRLIALGVRMMAAAHLGRDREVAGLGLEFRALGGADDDFATAVHGFGLTVLDLLAEDPDRAWRRSRWAYRQEARRPSSYLSLIHGPYLLLAVLRQSAGPAECAALRRSVQAQAGWNRQFLELAEAVLHGRSGQPAEASAALERFRGHARRYPLAHHLGLRLVVPEAVEHRWGEPAAWLREVEAYGRDRAPQVARACRQMLRDLVPAETSVAS